MLTPDYISGTVSGPVTLSFGDMKLATEVFNNAVLEAITGGESEKACELCALAERFGFSVTEDVPDFTPGQGQEHLVGLVSETTATPAQE